MTRQSNTPEPIGAIPVLFLTETEAADIVVEPQEGDVEEQVRLPWKPKATKAVVEQIDGDELKKSLDTITGQLQKVLDNQGQPPSGGFALDSFKIGLKIVGKGKIALVAEVGGEASIELTFNRR